MIETFPLRGRFIRLLCSHSFKPGFHFTRWLTRPFAKVPRFEVMVYFERRTCPLRNLFGWMKGPLKGAGYDNGWFVPSDSRSKRIRFCTTFGVKRVVNKPFGELVTGPVLFDFTMPCEYGFDIHVSQESL